MATEAASVAGTKGPHLLQMADVPKIDDDLEEFDYAKIVIPEEEAFDEDRSEDLDTVMQRAQLCNMHTAAREEQEPTVTRHPEVIDDFIRNFFVKFNLNRYEMQAAGKLPAAATAEISDAYEHNASLSTKVIALRAEVEQANKIAAKASSTWDSMRKERDFHRMHHKRVGQEKNKLIKDIKQLKAHYDKYEPAIKILKKKYETLMREKMLISIERDKLRKKVEQHPLCGNDEPIKTAISPNNSQSTSEKARDTTWVHPVRKQRSQSPSTLKSRAAATSPASIRTVGATLPVSARKNPFESRDFAPVTGRLFRAEKTFLGHKLGVTQLALHPRKPVVVRLPFHIVPNCTPRGDQQPEVNEPEYRIAVEVDTSDFYYVIFACFKGHAREQMHCGKPHVSCMQATASDDRSWRMWHLPEGGLVMSGEGHSDWVAALAFHPRGICLASGSGDATVRLWDFQRQACVATLSAHTAAVWSLAFHDAGEFLASASLDHAIRLWDLTAGSCKLALRGHVDSVNSVAWLAFTNTLASASSDKTLSLWDARTGLTSATFYGHTNSINAVAASLDNRILASVDADGFLRTWDIRMVTERGAARIGGARPLPLNSVALDASGNVAVTAGDDGIARTVWVGAEGEYKLMEVLKEFSGHEGPVQAVVFDPAGEFILTASSDSTFKLWK